MRILPWPAPVAQVDTEEFEEPQPMSLVIMNPPFTRDSLRHDQFSRADELRIKEREKAIIKTLDDPSAARLSGAANAFLVLAERLNSAADATLAVVLPTVIATNPAARGIRKYLARKYHIETIVSSHDPKRILMSENSTISEMLIVGRRWSGERPKPSTRFVNLIENPSIADGALFTVDQIAQGSGRFVIQDVEAERVENDDWHAVNFLAPYLVTEARMLWSSATQAESKFVSMSQIADVGPEGRRVRDAYTRSDVPTASGRRALWHHKTDVTQSMSARTDSYIEPKAGNEKLANKYWKQRSYLLLAHRVRLNTARVASVIVEQRAVGSLWTPCRPHDKSDESLHALCVYLNSPSALWRSSVGALTTYCRALHSRSTCSARFPCPTFRGLAMRCAMRWRRRMRNLRMRCCCRFRGWMRILCGGVSTRR